MGMDALVTDSTRLVKIAGVLIAGYGIFTIVRLILPCLDF